MGEDYYSMNREELIEKLKSKDEQITQMSKKYDCLKADATNEIEEAKAMRFEEFARVKRESELSGLKAENELLKDTIVAMATYTYPGVANFDKTFKSINHNLEMLRKGR